jgi:hypothetical protein
MRQAAFFDCCAFCRKKSSSHWRRLLVCFASGVYTVVLSDAFYVGFAVHVKHFAPTPRAISLIERAELLEVANRKLRFKVGAHDEDKKVGEGTHDASCCKSNPPDNGTAVWRSISEDTHRLATP